MTKIPSRASVRGDDGFAAFPLSLFPASVFLDGKEIEDVFAYDMDTGQVWTYLRDSDGNLFVRNDEAASQVVSGESVTVIPNCDKK